MLRIAFVGAGAVNFGGSEGLWDHATRLEKIGNCQVVAIVDPLQEKAKSVLQVRQNGPHSDMYKECKIYASVPELIQAIKVDAIFIGIPPVFRGSLEKGKDIELMCMKAGIHAFVEKPVSNSDPEEFRKYVNAVAQVQKQANLVVSVGYMFRYHAAVRKMKELIRDHGGKVMAFNGRYHFAYPELDHAFWWDVSKSGGPIVEQATHFCDLARFLVGEVNLPSIQTTCLKADDPSGTGNIKNIPEGMESGLSSSNRVPRVTCSHWRFINGGIGSLMHTVALHGKKYESQIDVLMDGLRMTLYEPYHPECKLLIRDGKTNSDLEVSLDYGRDDPYETEINSFINAVNTKNPDGIASSYEDAAKTYEFTCAIRHSGN